MHEHAGDKTGNGSVKRIGVAFFLNFGFTILELVGGLWTNSAAILADSLHDLGDSLSLGLSWYFARLSARERTARFSYGYRRFSLLASLISGVVLIIGSLLILSRAVPRLFAPQHSNAQGMIALAVIGIAVNGAAVLRMRSGRTLNERVVTWHLAEDALGWIAVLITGIFISFYDLHVLDPILSVLITLYVLRNVLKNTKEAVLTFLQTVPDSFNLSDIERKAAALPGVKAVHDTHIWSLDGEYAVLTTHVVVSPKSTAEEMYAVKCCVTELVKKDGIDHLTIEIEREGEICHGMTCEMSPGNATGPTGN